jgi:hypothetical protein
MDNPETPELGAAPPIRRRRRLRIVAWSFLGLFLLLAMGPSIAQFGPLRTMLLRLATPGLNGTIHADQANFGWFTPVHVAGLTIRDPEGATVVEIPDLHFNSTLWTLITGDHDLGRLRIRDLRVNVVAEATGGTNLRRVFGPMKRQGNLLDRLRGHTLDIEVEDVQIHVRTPDARGDWRAGDIDFLGRIEPTGADGAPQLLIRQCKLLDRTELTPGFCQDVLSYILPPLAGAATTEGAVSIDLNDGVVPLEEPRKLNVSGAVTIHDVSIGTGALTQSLTDLLATLQAPAKFQLANNSVVQFAVADERVTHHGLEFGVPQVRVRTEGSVGFDQTLDLEAEVILALGENEKRPYLTALGNQNLKVPIGGTFAEPKIDLAGAASGDANWFKLIQTAGTLWSKRKAAQSTATPSNDLEAPENLAQDSQTGEASGVDVGEIMDNLPVGNGEIMNWWSERQKRRAAEREAAAEQQAADGTPPPPPAPRRRLLDRFRDRGQTSAPAPPATQ